MRPTRRVAHRRWAALAAAAVGLAALLTAAPAHAGVDDFEFESMHADFHLDRDKDGNATLDTTETIVAIFPDFDQNRGILRAIPRVYGEVDLDLRIRGVFDENGRPHPYSTSTDGDFTVVRIGDPNAYVHGRQTYVIQYTSRHVVRGFADTGADEFYWDVNGTGWAQPFGLVSASLHLGEGLEDQLTGDAACYWGYSGSTDRCEITRTADGFEAAVTDLAPRQNMTIAIGFHPDTFTKPLILREHWVFTLLPWLLLGASALLWAYTLLYRLIVWRDHPGRGIIIPQYSAPDDAYPALAAHLMGKKRTALPSQLIDFTVQGVIKIRENLGSLGENRWELELLIEPSELGKEKHHIAKSVFGEAIRGKRVTLRSSDQKLGDRLAALTTVLEKRLASRGWMVKPKTGASSIAAGITGWILTALIALWAIATFILEIDNVALWAAPWGAFFLWLWASAAAKPPYVMSESGAAVRDHLLGIRDYLRLAEADRIRMLQAPDTAERIDVTDRQAVVKLYEKLLPYAIIFGIEHEWLRELGRDYETLGSPEWASGTANLYSINAFSHSVTSTRFATTPPPSSSGSSWSSSGGSSFSGGSSGGGSSGGGGGGGGGGGW